MSYFKVKIGYGEDEAISIETIADLEKAQYAFLTDGKVIFSNGEICRGKDIITISEDWHREMGWNRTHKLGNDDWNELNAKGITGKYKGLLTQTKEKVQYLIENQKTHLIGKDIDIPELRKIETNIVDGSSLAEKFRI